MLSKQTVSIANFKLHGAVTDSTDCYICTRSSLTGFTNFSGDNGHNDRYSSCYNRDRLTACGLMIWMWFDDLECVSEFDDVMQKQSKVVILNVSKFLKFAMKKKNEFMG